MTEKRKRFLNKGIEDNRKRKKRLNKGNKMLGFLLNKKRKKRILLVLINYRVIKRLRLLRSS